MTAMPAAGLMTADEFLALPQAPRHERWSLVEGELVMEQPLPSHQVACVEILYALESWVRSRPGRGRALIPIDVELDERNIYAPDVLWYAEGRDPARANVRPSPIPDLAVEVRSPSTWRYDIGAKKSVYERRGLPELWLVDTAASVVLVFRRSATGAPRFDVALELTAADSLESPLLPGSRCRLRGSSRTRTRRAGPARRSAARPAPPAARRARPAASRCPAVSPGTRRRRPPPRHRRRP